MRSFLSYSRYLFVLMVGLFVFGIGNASAEYNNKYSNVQEYFNYVDSHKLPRVMLIGGEHISYVLGRKWKESQGFTDDSSYYDGYSANQNTDHWYKDAGGAQNYFFVNINPKAEPDCVCDATTEKFLELGEEKWDVIVFEGVGIDIGDCKALKNALSLLKVGGRMPTYISKEIEVCSQHKKLFCNDCNDMGLPLELVKLDTQQFTLEYILNELKIPAECVTVNYEEIKESSILYPMHDEDREYSVGPYMVLTRNSTPLPKGFGI